MLVLVDSSVWVDLLSSRPKFKAAPDDFLKMATCGPVVQEILQGLRESPQSNIIRSQFLYLPRLSDPVPLSCFTEAAEIYRAGRKRGLTIRSSVDCLIAAIAISNQVPVWHNDRDFSAIAKFTKLEVVSGLAL